MERRINLPPNLPPDQVLCFHVMHCAFCDKGYYSLVAGEKHEAKCEAEYYKGKA